MTVWTTKLLEGMSAWIKHFILSLARDFNVPSCKPEGWFQKSQSVFATRLKSVQKPKSNVSISPLAHCTSPSLQVSWLGAAMWEESLPSKGWHRPVKGESLSPSHPLSLLLPPSIPHEDRKMTITSRQSFNVLTVVFLLLSTAGLWCLPESFCLLVF